jgi:antitoxin FitA
VLNLTRAYLQTHLDRLLGRLFGLLAKNPLKALPSKRLRCSLQIDPRNNRRVIAVASITIELSDSQFQKLQDLATVHGIALDVLLRASLGDWLSSQKSDFSDASNYVLTKNAELYRRLA